MFVSGQLGQQNVRLVSDSLEVQTLQAIANIADILKQHDLDLSNVMDVTAFLVDQTDYAAFNEVYAKSFAQPYPTRTTVTVRSLPLDAKVELKVVAAKAQWTWLHGLVW